MLGKIRLFTVPSFTERREIVFLDINSLEAYSYEISLDAGKLGGDDEEAPMEI